MVIAQWRYEEGTDVNTFDEFYEETSLHCMCYCGDTRAIQLLLLQNGAKVNAVTSYGETPLHMCRSANMAILLIRFGADVTRVDIDGRTPLHNISPRHRIDVEAYAAEVERKRKEERERQRLYAMAVLERQRSPYFAVADIGSIMVRFL